MSYPLKTLINNMLALVEERPEGELLQTQQVVSLGSFSYVASVKAMETMSHIIEDAVTDSPGVVDLYVSFQRLSRVRNQFERYAKVAREARRLVLAGEVDWQAPNWPSLQVVDTTNDPMIDYWFVVADGGGIHMALLAQEVPTGDGQRRYKGFFTLDRAIAHKVATTVRQLLDAKLQTQAGAA